MDSNKKNINDEIAQVLEDLVVVSTTLEAAIDRLADATVGRRIVEADTE